jgi:hypothetical protein
MERITKVCTLVLAAMWTALHFPLHVIERVKESPVVLHRSDQEQISTDLSKTSHDYGMPDDAPELFPPVPGLPPFVNNEAVFDAANRRIMAPRPSALSFISSPPLVLLASAEGEGG